MKKKKEDCGKWIFHEDFNESIKFGCNQCGNLTNIPSNFCPNCGAKMEKWKRGRGHEKNKQMSKNELCSYIHALTGKSFKETRAICKAAKWNAKTAFMLATLGNDNFERICKSINDTTNALVSCLTPVVKSACETIREFAQALAQGINDGLDNPPSGAIMQAIRNENEGGADNAGI